MLSGFHQMRMDRPREMIWPGVFTKEDVCWVPLINRRFGPDWKHLASDILENDAGGQATFFENGSNELPLQTDFFHKSHDRSGGLFDPLAVVRTGSLN